MKISPAMVEAGAAKWVEVKNLSPEALVAAVYSAMEGEREREEHKTKLGANLAPQPYVYQAWPAWRYGPNGESKVFQCAEDVPEGWTDSVQVHALERDADVLDGTLPKRGPGRPRKVAA